MSVMFPFCSLLKLEEGQFQYNVPSVIATVDVYGTSSSMLGLVAKAPHLVPE